MIASQASSPLRLYRCGQVRRGSFLFLFLPFDYFFYSSLFFHFRAIRVFWCSFFLLIVLVNTHQDLLWIVILLFASIISASCYCCTSSPTIALYFYDVTRISFTHHPLAWPLPLLVYGLPAIISIFLSFTDISIWETLPSIFMTKWNLRSVMTLILHLQVCALIIQHFASRHVYWWWDLLLAVVNEGSLLFPIPDSSITLFFDRHE